MRTVRLGPSCKRVAFTVLRSRSGEAVAFVLVASRMMGCDSSCCFVMLWKRVDGNPK